MKGMVFRTDREIVDKLIANDEDTIKEFFFERCRRALCYIGQYFCHGKQTPEELIGEFYEFLSADDWHRLRIFRFTCSLNSYITIIASRYFQNKRNEEMLPLDEDIVLAKGMRVEAAGDVLFMDYLQRLIERMQPLDRFLVQRILIEGEKPGDILEEAAEMVMNDEFVSTMARNRQQFAGYIYTRYNRVRKSLQKEMMACGYGK